MKFKQQKSHVIPPPSLQDSVVFSDDHRVRSWFLPDLQPASVLPFAYNVLHALSPNPLPSALYLANSSIYMSA